MKRTILWIWLGLCGLGLAACGQDGTPFDGGIDDAALEDAGREDGSEDAGGDDAGLDDAGLDDAGLDDAGLDDAGTDDAGGEDAGEEDAGADEDPGPVEHLLGYACSDGLQGRPYGGGEGYGAWLDPSGPRTTLVLDKAGLLAALAAAGPGDVVYVDDEAIIDLGSERDQEIRIGPGVTLASGRGRNGALGALLYTDDHDRLVHAARSLLTVTGPDARITGLRLRGPDQAVGETYASPMAYGLRTAFSSSIAPIPFEVDNCEFYGWTDAGVSVYGTSRAMVHHNYFHHNRRAGLGYGVVVNWAYPIIGANVFDHNRHGIAATGYPTTSYEACHNLVLANATSFSFDMHGGFDKGFYPDTAGSTLLIHDNIFLAAGVDGVGVRGVPDTEARIDDNRFVHNSAHNYPSAIWQRMWPEAPDCLSTGGCVVSPWEDHEGYLWMEDKALCVAACAPSIKLRAPAELVDISCSGNRFAQPHLTAWYVAFSGQSYWHFREFSNLDPTGLLFGDLDGDGADDGFRAAGGTWTLYPGLRLPGRQINASGASQADLGLADFDGDGQADVFWADGSHWQVAWSGQGPWQQLNTSTYPRSALHLADFDGDGRADVFSANGSSWRVSFGGNSAWQEINSMSQPLSALRFGDFDGDGTCDVFYADGGRWWVSWSGSSAWQQLNTSSVTDIAVADLNGDGRADVFRANGSDWRVSYGGNSSWQVLQALPETLPALRFADVNGDGAADILSLR